MQRTTSSSYVCRSRSRIISAPVGHVSAQAPHDTQSVYDSDTFHGVVTIESYPPPIRP
jgi:hypothetical protein